MLTSFVINAMLVVGNSMGEMLTGLNCEGGLTTHLFGLGNHAGTISKSNTI